MSAHAPGPWAVGVTRSGRRHIYAANGKRVGSASSEGTKAERWANERVLENSLAMLEALERVSKECTFYSADLIAQVRAVIAKARGASR